MIDPIADRRRVLRTLREEVLGPSTKGRVLPAGHALHFETVEEFFGPHIQAGTLNEIVKGESPRRRYGAGILFPAGMRPVKVEDPEAGAAVGREGQDKPESGGEVLTDEAKKNLEKSAERGGGRGETDGDEMGISLANELRPSSMGLSFLADIADKDVLRVVVKAGRYRNRSATLKRSDDKEPRPHNWWFRSVVAWVAEFRCKDLLATSGLVKPASVTTRNAKGLALEIQILSRPLPALAAAERFGRLLTVSVVNRTPIVSTAQGEEDAGHRTLDEICTFQTELSVTVPGENAVLPYPERLAAQLDDEERSLALLYRHAQTFATGHGCAADWRFPRASQDRARKVRGVPVPVEEVPGTTPDVLREDGSRILVDMRALAGLAADTDGMAAASEVVERYGRWIESRMSESKSLDASHQNAANAHLLACKACHERMVEGIELLKSDAQVRRAFQLANHAILLQQERSFRSARKMKFDPEAVRIEFEPAPPPPKGRGTWRPFQLAFLLMCLKSASDGRAPDREVVELIWFPTGGGKTEAYLGLTAFALFHRRLKNPADDGTHVLMRYTLRLLTAQQFQRASGLICAMDHLRRSKHGEGLGDRGFSIGIWLGGDTTPNSRDEARESLRRIESGADSDYNFILLRCPWCGAEMGPVEQSSGPKPRGRSFGRKASGGAAPALLGLVQRGGTVALHCPDSACEYAKALPIQVVDEDIYATPPDVVIGTVDKFAGLAWKPAARALFGVNDGGQRVKTPPGLIIQDELHLITGPLGSMAGIYETLIEELCTDRRGEHPVKPKIIGSTATTRSYRDQILALYNRKESCLFPPPGLTATDSFFASARPGPGRMFVGINAPSYPSGLTTNVRVFSSLLQAARLLPDGEERDPWWTLLIFFNSLRELGNTLTLFQGDIPERIREISRRCMPDPTSTPDPKSGRHPPVVRYIGNPLELTSRISSAEVPRAISQLETTYQPKVGAVDVCLASNIIEVGVDIDRLSLMAVAGQPKTTAQYIQVTGRVGRRPDRPGLVAMIYSTSKPRDRSHFERFKSYHQRLYAQVEPSSVTPFTAPVLERALHATLVGYVRQLGDMAKTERPCPEPVLQLEAMRAILVDRANSVDPSAMKVVQEVLNLRLREWFAWKRDRWDPGSDTDNPSLLRYTSGYYKATWDELSWPTPSSMRSVDAECRPEISVLYRKNAVATEGEQPAQL